MRAIGHPIRSSNIYFSAVTRHSTRQLTLRELHVVVEERSAASILRYLVDADDSSEDEVDLSYPQAYENVLGSRYVDRPTS
ncbi:hypothetical protein GN958_ATG19240 [Phytophthora infestans]|uniref:Uncharacterized protein n=1 Tax=Phytophthora infestans TaxID=4787 RepID=A0A8S9TRR9_PHYIN|nr:hypothetical protein GN958_ATG19240 [Phytophthora infestans]